ncbi:MAG: hypothetical protein Q7J25_10255 [Vicinamibacterales bacterium]|nr:hypothetical protein [Vicinamibacterales bacterium]
MSVIEPPPTPRRRTSTLEKVSKALIIPLAIACMGAWNDYKIKREKLRADAGYETVAPAMKEMQTQVATLAGQVQVLQQLVLVLSQRPQPTPVVPPLPASANIALDAFKSNLVMKVQKSQGAPMVVQRQLPERLDDVPTKK